MANTSLPIEAAWLAEAASGRLFGNARARAGRCETDSRLAGDGAIFVALKGERVDGHDYIEAALKAGAAVVVADEAAWKARAARLEPALAASSAALILADDPLAALQAAGAAWRRRFPLLRRVGVTGSSGKTTSKECLAAIASRVAPTIFNPGNLNSEIGLPASMFLIRDEHRLGIFEMGINRRGEMDALVAVWDPRIALITNVGTAHIGILGSRQAIAEEKKRVFSQFSSDGLAFVWEDDEFRDFLSEGVAGEVATFGPRSAGNALSAEPTGLDGWRLRYHGRDFRFPLPGAHNLLDAYAAIAVAERLGAGSDEVAAGLESIRPLFGRSEIFHGTRTVVSDCYNANPDSVRGAMELCDGIEWAGRRVYIVGSMLELGAESAASHRAVGLAAARSKADAFFVYGEEARPAFEAARESGFSGLLLHYDDFDALSASVLGTLRDGDLVLLKASRGMALERLIPLIAPNAAQADHH